MAKCQAKFGLCGPWVMDESPTAHVSKIEYRVAVDPRALRRVLSSGSGPWGHGILCQC